MTKIDLKKFFVLFSAVIITAIFAGCSDSAPDPDKARVPSQDESVNVVEGTGTEEEVPGAAGAGPEDAAKESSDTEEELSQDTGAAAEEGVSADSAVTTGGYPWIDSSIKANLTEDMELSAKDDFYLFVNHDWLMSHDIPDVSPYYRTFDETGSKIDDNITKLMNDSSVQGHEAELAQTFYHALLDWDTRNKVGIEPFREKVTTIKEISDINELTAFICDMDKSCYVPSCIGIGNVMFFEDSSRYIVEIGDITQSLILKNVSDYKKRTETGEIYYHAAKELMESMLTRIGFSEDEADAVLERAITFETELSDVLLTPEQLSSPEHLENITNLYDMDGLKELFQAYPIEELLESSGYISTGQYQVANPDYAAKLGSLYNEEYLEQIKDYMIVRYCIQTVKYFDSEAYEAYNQYYNTLYGSSGNMTDTYYAAGMTRSYLPDAIAKAYADYYHLEYSKEKIRKLCEDIISAYEEMLQEEDWLSEETKEKAVEKLKNININSVYPDKWTDYSSLEFEGDSLYRYFEQIADFKRRLDASLTDQTVDKGSWGSIGAKDPLITSAGYSADLNAMYIYAGIVADPMYNENMSDEELYGHLAFIIGHEISHAFDSGGSLYDKDGNLKNWWTDEDKKAFDERVEKLIEYYDGISVWSGLNVSGRLDQKELIADMGSIKALLRLAKDKKDFDYEVFFKAYAKCWRCVINYEFEYFFAKQDPHPPYYLRCNAVVQQFQEFYDTFGIEEGDGMYLAPEDRVAVW